MVAAAAGLLVLLFVALSIHVRALSASRNAELRAVARSGLRATGVGFDRKVTVWRFLAGFGLFIVTIASGIRILVGEANALYVIAGVAVLSLLWASSIPGS